MAFNINLDLIHTFPLGREEIKALIVHADEDRKRSNSWLHGSDKVAYLDVLHRVKEFVGPHPHVQYCIARIMHEKVNRARTAAWRRAEHEKRQDDWRNGGRAAHFLKKWGVFGWDMPWLNSLLGVETGCAVNLDEDWDDYSHEECGMEDQPIPVYVEPRCPHCLARGCRDFCGMLLLPVAPRPEEKSCDRSIPLARRLRAIIVGLDHDKYNLAYVWAELKKVDVGAHHNLDQAVRTSLPYECGEPQMEGLNGEQQTTIQSGNTVLVESNPASTSIASVPQFRYDWHQLCSSEKETDYSYLTDRFTYYKTVTWKTTQTTGTEIKDFATYLPVDFVSSVAADGSMPMFVPFKIFRYFKSDIEIKFHVNSNKFQVGQLQFSWQYMEKYDGNVFNNIYSRSQLPHVLVNAGASNEATLTIPYKYVLPYLATHQKKQGLAKLYLGTLRCYVVSPLAVGTGGPDTCNVSMFIKFPNAIFTGMRDGSIAEPQMEAAATAMVVGAVVNKLVGDKNCDNVSDNVNPQYLVPTGTHSWCAGKGLQERLHSFRLDNSTLGVGRIGIDDSETSIGVPCRVFGMLKHFSWSVVDNTKNSPGSLLWSCDAHAQLQKSVFHKDVNENALDTYALPPVSVIAGLFKQWRGSLEFRFDIIASQFHTGRLLCAYIPGFYGDASSITIAQARNSPCVEFSLQDSTSFTFVVPYISDTVFWPRRYTGPHKYSEHTAPSKVVLFVLNPLIPMQSVVNSVTIVPYVRAGVDFEVSVPVQPSVGLSDEVLSKYVVKDLIFPTAGSYPYRATNYEGFGGDKKYILYEGTSALGTASTFHAPEKKLAPNEYCYGKAQDSTAQTTLTYVIAGEKKNSYASFIVLWSVPDKGNFGIPFPSGDKGEANAKIVAKMLRQGRAASEILPFCFDYIDDGRDSSSDISKLYFDPVFETIDKEEIGEPQMEQRVAAESIMSPTASLPSTSGGNFNYNESFTDLKDLARRYQLYADKDITVSKGYKADNAFALFPVIPHGLALDISSTDSMFNLCRDGHIPIISSSYIYFRGSIRFKIVLSSDAITLSGAKVWVQHHPDGDCSKHSLQTFPNISYQDSFKSHSYSFYIQPMRVNSVIEFEIPFYQPGMYGLTRKPSSVNTGDVCQYYSLGNILVGAYIGKLDKGVDFNFKVFYSIGDDFSFSTFRGFPMMLFTDDVWPDKQEKKIVWITGDAQMEDASPEMMASIKDYFIGAAVKNITLTAVQEARSVVLKEAEELQSKFHKAFNNSTRFVLNVPTVTACLGNLAHVIANPTPKTVAVAIANVLIALLGATITNALKLIESVVAVVMDYWHRFTGDSDTASPQGEDDSRSLDAFYALIFTSVCCLGGFSVSPPSKFPDVLRNINGCVSLYNNSIRLIQNSADLVTYCIKYIISKLNPEAALCSKLLNDVPDIQDWYKECNYLLDVRNRSRYLYDRKMLARVFDATVMGSILVSSGLRKSVPGGKVIFDTHRDMRKLQCDLFERGAHPDVRFEPFPLWLSGAPGIGKSFMVKKLVNDLLKHVGYSAPGSLIYDIPSGAKYWSGCQNPAALVSDDLFQVAGTKMEDEIANIFMICSSSVLNPPMAAVEDKERRLNPLLYVMLCNSHFPNLSPTCMHPEAVYRRRKFLIEARLTPGIYEGNFRDASQLPKEILANMEHIQFRYALNVKDSETEYTAWMSYNSLLDIISESFRTHYMNERENFKQRMQDMYCLDPNYDEQNLVHSLPDIADKLSLKEQIDVYKAHIENQLDRYNDPTREPEIADYIIRFKEKIVNLKNSFQMDAMFEIPPAPLDHVPIGSMEMIFPDVFAHFQKIIQREKDYYLDSWCVNSTLFQNVHDYAGLFSSSDISWFEIMLQNKLNTFFSLDSISCNTWYTVEIKNFLDQGNFDVLEIIRFLSSFENGAEICAISIFGGIPEAACSLQIDTNEEIRSAEYLNLHTDDLVFHNEIKKKALRESLSDIKLVSPVTARQQFIKAARDWIFGEVCGEVSRTIALVISNLKDLIGVRILVGMITPAQYDVSVLAKIIKCILRFVSALILADVIYGESSAQHCCNSMFSFNLILNRPTVAKFCSVRRLLEYAGKEISQCSVKSCVYNNDMLYYFICISVVGCGKWTEVVDGPFGRVVASPLEFNDIHRALRYRNVLLSQNIFMRLGRWLKHTFYHVLPELLSGVYNAIINHLPKILMVLGLSVVASGAGYLYHSMPTMSIRDVSASGNKEANYFKFDQPKVPKLPKPNVAPRTFGRSQMSAMNRKVIGQKVEQNTVLLHVTWVEDGKRQVRSCRNIMLRGRAMLVLRHYLEEYQYLVDHGFEIECYLFFGKGDRICKVPITWAEIVNSVAWCSSSIDKITSNYGIVILPSYIPQFKDIIKRFASKPEHSNIPSVADLYVVNGDSSFNMPLSVKTNFCVSGTSTSSAVYIDRVYSYNKQYKGLCGSVLVAPTLGSGLGAIIGLHVAGNENSGLGYAEPIYREMFEQFFEIYPQPQVMEVPVVAGEVEEVVLDSNLMVYGCVPKQFAHKESGKTKIVPSLLHGSIYEVKTEVNPLRPNDPRQPPGSHPLRDGCNKHGCGDVRVYDAALVEVVKEHMSDYMQQVVRPVRAEVKPLSLNQAVCGDVDVPYFESLNWKSSEGFPLSSHRPKDAHDKKWLFDLEEGKFGYQLKGVHPLLEQQLKLRDLCFKDKIKPPTVYIDCLKDYRLSPAKCKIPGKTRIFSVAPIQCSIDIRMYINDFCASIKNSRIVNSIGIGINPDSLEWTQLVQYYIDASRQ